MFDVPYSFAMERTSPITPNLLAEYDAAPGNPANPDTLEMTTIEPPDDPNPCIWALRQFRTPVILTLRCKSHVSSDWHDFWSANVYGSLLVQMYHFENLLTCFESTSTVDSTV